jgi:DNA-binding transcriptional ArsR family regulator
MAIRFHLPANALDRVAFAYSPLLEAALSLHVLVEPKHHPLQHEWVRAMRALKPALRREVGAFSFLYRTTLADVFLPSPSEEYRDFGLEVERLRRLDQRTVAYELTRPLHDHGGAEPRDPRLDDADVRASVLRSAELHGPESVRVAQALLEDPVAVARRLATLLESYWEAAFAAEWEQLEPRLAAAVTEAGRQLADDGVYSLLLRLAPQLRVDAGREEFGIDVRHEHRVEVGDDQTLVLAPSYFVWPHVRVNCDQPWPLTLVYPAGFVLGAARRELPSGDFLRSLRAVADATRLRALKLIAERPRSTQELARLIGISEAGLSKHLRLMAHAGLLTTRREGYYVLYSLVPERVEAVASALQTYLAREPGQAGKDSGSPTARA